MLISIITPTKNVEKTLLESLESVMPQVSDDIEHLLVDACSKDATLSVANRFPHLKVTSEPDRGIYDAMNKGARKASGEWLLFLQADDWLPEGTIEAYRDAIESFPDAHMIGGGADAVKWEESCWKTMWSVHESADKELTVQNISLHEPMINARLIRKDVFERLGGFSLEYSLAADRDFLLNAAESKLRQPVIGRQTYRYRWHAGSSTMTEGNDLSGRLFAENIRIASHHLRLVSRSERSSVRRWHTRLHVQGAMDALESGSASKLWHHVIAGTSADCHWPFALFREFFRSLPGFVTRGFRTRSGMLRKGHVRG